MLSLDPVVGFFALGLAAGFLRSDLKLSSGLLDTLSLYLLIAIGLKGGLELSTLTTPGTVLLSIMIAVIMSIGTPLLAYPVLRILGKMQRPDAASIAAHYGSVSVVTFAACTTYLANRGVTYEGYLAVLLVFLEFPALMIGVLLAKGVGRETDWSRLLHEVFTGKAIVLLIGSLAIGWLWGKDASSALSLFYGDLFKGFLTLFMLGMGVITASRFADVRNAGSFLIGFGIIVPVISAMGGVLIGWWLGLSVGGATLVATLYASASYIAAPAAMRIAIPDANPALSMGASLGVTFPFNLVLGIPLYHAMVSYLYGVTG